MAQQPFEELALTFTATFRAVGVFVNQTTIKEERTRQRESVTVTLDCASLRIDAVLFGIVVMEIEDPLTADTA